MVATALVFLIPLTVIAMATAIAYVVAGRSNQTEPSAPPPETIEGVLVQRVDGAAGAAGADGAAGAAGTTRLVIRTAPDVLVEVQADPRTALDLRVGQALRVQGLRRELPDVHGAIVDLRQPPEPKREFYATAITPLGEQRLTPPSPFAWLLIGVGIAVAIGAYAARHGKPPVWLFGLVILVTLVAKTAPR